MPTFTKGLMSSTMAPNPQQLEHDFIVHPGADPSQILVRFDGVNALGIG